MSGLFQKLKNNRFFRSLMMLSTGTIIAQLLAVLVSPILTRLLSEYELALFAFALSIVNTFQASINGAYNNGIVVEDNEHKVHALIKLSFVVGIVLSVLVGIGSYLYIVFFSKDNYPALLIAVFVLLTLLSTGLIQTLTAWNNRRKDYKTIAAVGIYRSVFQNLGNVLSAFLKLGAPGLLLSYVAGNAAGIRRQAKEIKPEIPAVLAVPQAEVKAVAKENYRYPLFTAPSYFVNSLSFSSITFFIEALFEFRLLAYYSMSMRILGLPLALISANVGKIFMADASNEFNKTGTFRKTFNRMSLFLTAVALPMGIVMFFFAPPLSRFVFGPGWEVAGEYIKILTPMFLIRFIATAVSPGYMICGKQRTDAFLQVLLLVASVSAFLLARTQHYPIESFLWAISIFKSLVYLVYFMLLWWYSRKTQVKPLKGGSN